METELSGLKPARSKVEAVSARLKSCPATNHSKMRQRYPSQGSLAVREVRFMRQALSSSNYKLDRRLIVLAGIVLAIAGLAGCTVGPNYKRPSVDVPGAYRGAAPDASDQAYAQTTPPPQAQPEPPVACPT